MDIEIKDKYSDAQYKQTKYLGIIIEEEIKKYMFFIEGHSPSGYDLTLTLWYRNPEDKENLQEAIIDVKQLELSPYMGGETVVDINDVINGYSSSGSLNGYEIMAPNDNRTQE